MRANTLSSALRDFFPAPFADAATDTELPTDVLERNEPPPILVLLP